MACFLVPAAEAVATTVATKVMKKTADTEEKISFTRKLKWLSNLLWGGCALSIYMDEHISREGGIHHDR
jgi:hypothetical protein